MFGDPPKSPKQIRYKYKILSETGSTIKIEAKNYRGKKTIKTYIKTSDNGLRMEQQLRILFKKQISTNFLYTNEKKSLEAKKSPSKSSEKEKKKQLLKGLFR